MKHLTIPTRVTKRDTNSFKMYLKDICDIDILTHSEEKVLTEKSSHGDKSAKDELVRRNLRFVISVAKQYATSVNPLEDLVNEGNIGLMMAADKFKADMGVRFISYAVWWIRKVIYEHLSKNGRMVRLPANKINSLSKLDKKINELEQKFGRNVDIQEIATEYGSEFINDDFEVLNTLTTYSMDSLDREIGNDGNTTTLSELISDDTTCKSTDYLTIESDIRIDISRILNSLKPRDKRVMTALYGLDGNIPMTLKEVGEEIGVTREMIRQIKEKNLKNLYNKLKNNSVRNIE